MPRLALVALVAGCHASGPTVDAEPQLSCGSKQPMTGDLNWTIMSGGVARTILVHVPTGYDASHPVPLVLNFHGYTSNGIQESILSLMSTKADAAGFVVMYPDGIQNSWNAGACCGTAASTNVDDIGFVRDLLATASDKLCIDPQRIYSTGMSNGGFMSHRIGCELADKFAAIAPVAGVIGVTTCTPARAIPVIGFHGTADQLVPYTGNASIGFPPVTETYAAWAMRDGCNTANATETFRNGDSHCSTYSGCTGGGEVTLCTVDGGGHTWPGGTPVPSLGTTTMDLSATDAMWTFFAAHPLR